MVPVVVKAESVLPIAKPRFEDLLGRNISLIGLADPVLEPQSEIARVSFNQINIIIS